MVTETYRKRVNRNMNRSLHKMNGIDYGIYAFLIGTALVFIYPFYYVLSASLSDPAQVIANPLLLYPINVTLSAYQLLLSTGTIWLGYYNSIIYTVSGTY
jgi:putative aldouronate transport system permease protein